MRGRMLATVSVDTVLTTGQEARRTAIFPKLRHGRTEHPDAPPPRPSPGTPPPKEATEPMPHATEAHRMHDTLLLFGATGDLAQRYLFPSLLRLQGDGLLPEDFRVRALALSPHDTGKFREILRERFANLAHYSPTDEQVAIQTLPAGRYACYSCRIEDDDFATPWTYFFKQWLPQSGEALGEGACFEQYLNDGHKDGYWDMRLFIPLR